MIRAGKPRLIPEAASPSEGLTAYSLAGVGIGGVIGAGFFLGSGLAIREAGPSIALAFLLGGVIMMQVLGAMTSINVNRLAHGSFRVYAEQLLGPYFGFLIGWVVFVSGILGIGSEALAMGVFVRYWLPHLPLPVLAVFFTLIVIGLNALGIQNFGRIETGMAFIKTIALLAFIVIGGYAIITYGTTAAPFPLAGFATFFPNGLSGFLQSMLIVIFAFAGIGAVAMASTELRNPRRDIHQGSIYMSAGIISVYVVSMFVLVSVVAWNSVSTERSPFVQALDVIGMRWASAGLNVVILLAAFSVMAATFYSAIHMLVSLAESTAAPRGLTRLSKRGLYRNAWLLVGIASLLIVALSFVMPPQLFNYLVSASSYFTFLNWTVNLITYLAWKKRRKSEETYESRLVWGRPGAYAAILSIGVLFIMSLRVADFRMGFYAAASAFLVISLSYIFWARVKQRKATAAH